MLSPKGTSSVLLAIVIISFFDYCVSLQIGEKGVCEQKIYYCGLNDTDVDNRSLKLLHVKIRPVCCKHYEYDGDTDQCVPICLPGCVNGTCTDVDTCTCAPGLTLVGHTCVPATCSNCEHGICVALNDCKCHTGYERIGSHCKPICDSCSNGNCVAPNHCSCFEGYEIVNSTCEPKCSSCSNGDCIAPDHCSCHPGYERINSICKPRCSSCGDEECVAPETCRPAMDSSPSEDGNTPICSPPCTNGNCLTPNQCFCNKGFDLVCSVVCHHGFCSRAGNCTCKPKKKGAMFRF